ncbi:SHOCT domain-containing protein [Natrinema halophilum]|uniref:SHOCT domain-containing protein n=1 Tax=Natrinema halophilum TaxID=1699371 RepID=A0A7D5KJZ3_9EURY|nr:SHOCT domain-containing protein [Natrinema halophilum]QLG49899.1 SHOCT domain-containing protein [Natrinema halophilum]
MTTRTEDTNIVTIVLVTLGILVVLPAIFMGVGMMGFGPMMGGAWGHGMWGGGTGAGWMALVAVLMQLLFVAAIVGAGYYLVRTLAGGDDTDRALEELRLAYARGDLNDEEYERRRDALERNE